MKKFPSILICIVFSCFVTSAQNKDEHEIDHAVRKLIQAMIDADGTQLDALTSDKLSYGHSSWLIEDKNAFIAAIIDGTSRFTSLDVSDQNISVSNDVAIVRHKLSGETNNKGQPPGHVNLGVLQIWQKEKGKWLLLARQATRLQ